MANVSRINGFSPAYHLNGSPYNGQCRKYVIAAGDANACGVGDLVVYSDQAAIGGYAAVEAVNAGTITAAELVGVIVGLLPINDSGGVTGGAGPVLDTPTNVSRAASVLRYALVADADDLVYEVQEDGVGGTIALASVGLNAGFVAAVPNTTTGASQFTLDSSSVAVTATLPLQVVGLVNRPNNEIGSFARWYVRIQTHAHRGLITAV
jgi:hypothetical protein